MEDMEICRLHCGAYIRDVGGGNAAHKDVCMLMKFNAPRGFCHTVTDIQIRANGCCSELTSGAPIKKRDRKSVV